MNRIKITISGPTGAGKSLLAGLLRRYLSGTFGTYLYYRCEDEGEVENPSLVANTLKTQDSRTRPSIMVCHSCARGRGQRQANPNPGDQCALCSKVLDVAPPADPWEYIMAPGLIVDVETVRTDYTETTEAEESRRQFELSEYPDMHHTTAPKEPRTLWLAVDEQTGEPDYDYISSDYHTKEEAEEHKLVKGWEYRPFVVVSLEQFEKLKSSVPLVRKVAEGGRVGTITREEVRFGADVYRPHPGQPARHVLPTVWQPIATIPADRVVIVGVWQNVGGGNFAWQQNFSYVGDHQVSIIRGYTHWSEAPEPPAKTHKGKFPPDNDLKSLY